jgi:repressor LexA
MLTDSPLTDYANSTLQNLPKRQKQLFDIIATDLNAGRTPVIAELVEKMGLARESSLNVLLQPLRDKGLISWRGGVRGRQRVIDFTEAGAAAGRRGVPLIGRIAAGPMILAESEVLEWIDPAGLLRLQPGDFFLEVRGDSMIGDGIVDGDRAQIRPGVAIGNGEIAAVSYEQPESGEHHATLKHVHHSPKQKTVRLRASNPNYEDMILPAEHVHIVGAFRGLYRAVG